MIRSSNKIVMPKDTPQQFTDPSSPPPHITVTNEFHDLFDATPISLWKEDASDVKTFLDQLRQEGVTDFRSHFDNHPEIILHCMSLIKVVDINQATLKLYKANSKQELFDNMSTVMGPEAFDTFKEALILLGNGGTLFEREGSNYTLDGEELNVLIRWSVTPGYEDTLSQIIVSILDITARKQMELQLRRRLQEAKIIGQVITLTSSADDLNDALTSICTELAHFLNVPQAAFALPNDQRTASQVVAEYLAPGRPSALGSIITWIDNPSITYILEHRTPLAISDVQTSPLLASFRDIVRHRDIASILIAPIFVQEEIVGTIGFDDPQPREFSQSDIEVVQRAAAQVSQIIQRKRAEQELQTQRDFAHQIMDTMGQGLVVIDTTWHIEYSNQAFAQLLGSTPEELVGFPWRKLLFAEDQKSIVNSKERWLTGETQTFEIPLKHADGSEVPMLITAVPRWRNDRIDGAIAVFTDLTKHKEIEKELATARDQAIETSRYKSEFLANMSHEIRTPLNAIIGMTSLLSDTSLTAEQQDYAQTIRSSGDVLLSLINDILDFSKIEAGKLELENQPFDLRDCVEEALDVVITEAAEKGLEIAYEIDAQVSQTIIGDVTRLRQILVNLLNNAIKFTKSGEVILLVSENLPSNMKDNDDLEDECVLHFAIQDTGIGIPEDRRNRLFESFSQLDASTTRKHGGTGLGLTISKRLVELMGGTIWVESEMGKGSTFHFTLKTKSGFNHRRVYLRGNQPILTGKRLLIVDDNHTNRLILTKQTRLWGMEPAATASGAKALKWIHQGQSFDAAVLDMHMPEMDGLTLGAAIRQHRDEKHLPMIMLSSVGNQKDREENDHFAAILTKPVKPQRLFDILTSLFDSTAVPARQTVPQHQFNPQMGINHPLRILLAEDNLVNQKVAIHILKRMGYRTDLAATGLEVLEAMQRKTYDVILMDVQMPDMDGIEATQQIRDIWPEEQQPRIIAMTANALAGDREKYLGAGMDDYISKPVRIQELLHSLANSQALSQE